MTGKFVFLLGPNLLGSLLTWFKDSAPLETLTINNCKILYTPKDWDYSSSLSYALIFEIINYPYLLLPFSAVRWRWLQDGASSAWRESRGWLSKSAAAAPSVWQTSDATHPPQRPIWPLSLHSIRSSITLFFLFLCSFCCFSFSFSFFLVCPNFACVPKLQQLMLEGDLLVSTSGWRLQYSQTSHPTLHPTPFSLYISQPEPIIDPLANAMPV